LDHVGESFFIISHDVFMREAKNDRTRLIAADGCSRAFYLKTSAFAYNIEIHRLSMMIVSCSHIGISL
jgi:hypothetical protein